MNTVKGRRNSCLSPSRKWVMHELISVNGDPKGILKYFLRLELEGASEDPIDPRQRLHQAFSKVIASQDHLPRRQLLTPAAETRPARLPIVDVASWDDASGEGGNGTHVTRCSRV